LESRVVLDQIVPILHLCTPTKSFRSSGSCARAHDRPRVVSEQLLQLEFGGYFGKRRLIAFHQGAFIRTSAYQCAFQIILGKRQTDGAGQRLAACGALRS
jgi:hypothetical protein